MPRHTCCMAEFTQWLISSTVIVKYAISKNSHATRTTIMTWQAHLSVTKCDFPVSTQLLTYTESPDRFGWPSIVAGSGSTLDDTSSIGVTFRPAGLTVKRNKISQELKLSLFLSYISFNQEHEKQCTIVYTICSLSCIYCSEPTWLFWVI